MDFLKLAGIIIFACLCIVGQSFAMGGIADGVGGSNLEKLMNV